MDMDSKTPSKNHTATFKSKFCLCFKPVSSVDDAFESAAYSNLLSSAFMAGCKEGTAGWRRSSPKKGGDDTGFWQILKKAFNDNTLLKKMKRRKAVNKKKISKSSSIIKLERKSDKVSKEERKSNRSSIDSSSLSLLTRSSLTSSTNSSSSSQILGSSSPSSTNTHGLTPTIKRREDANVKDKEKGPDNKALCLMMTTSLLVLILWGKFFAIICTSFWFYLMPSRREQSDRSRPGYDEGEEFDTVEYKKKVIMEGLLERKRSPLSMDSIAKSYA